MIYIKPGVRMNLSIPEHGELGPGILRALIRKSGLTVEQFVEFLAT